VTTGPGGGIGENTVYTVTFSGGTSGTFNAVNSSGDPMGNGNFTYAPSGTTAQLRMDYANFPGDHDDMTLIFTTQPGGGASQYTGTQVVGGTTYPFNGTFIY
jgi:hypothetical protein